MGAIFGTAPGQNESVLVLACGRDDAAVIPPVSSRTAGHETPPWWSRQCDVLHSILGLMLWSFVSVPKSSTTMTVFSGSLLEQLTPDHSALSHTQDPSTPGLLASSHERGLRRTSTTFCRSPAAGWWRSRAVDRPERLGPVTRKALPMCQGHRQHADHRRPRQAIVGSERLKQAPPRRRSPQATHPRARTLGSVNDTPCGPACSPAW